MEATLTVSAAGDFGRENFSLAELGDRRRTDRLVDLAEVIVAHPGGTLPQKLSEPADLKALYRLMNRPEVTHASVLEAHRQLTLSRMRQCAAGGGVVLTLNDTTQLDYTTRRSLDGLGQLAKGRHRGYLCHNTLAVAAATGDVIGLANQILHARPRVNRKESRRQRLSRPDRETRLWKSASEAVGTPPDGTPPGALWVDVCDRGADLFEYLDHKHRQGGWYIVRSKHDRNVEAGHGQAGEIGQTVKLHAHARGLPDLCTKDVSVSADAKAGTPARQARVRVAAAPVRLPAPDPPYGEHGEEPLDAWVVHVKELDPPAEVKEPLEWVLLTNVPALGAEDARTRMDWYARRPVIEEYHKAMKTGCGIELPQLTKAARLRPLIALLSVVAVQLLRLRDAAQRDESASTPAASLFAAEYVTVLNAVRWRQPDRGTTAREFLYALARLGGHQNRKRDGPPGWLTIWRGWARLQGMVEGVRAMGTIKPRCG